MPPPPAPPLQPQVSIEDDAWDNEDGLQENNVPAEAPIDQVRVDNFVVICVFVVSLNLWVTLQTFFVWARLCGNRSKIIVGFRRTFAQNPYERKKTNAFSSSQAGPVAPIFVWPVSRSSPPSIATVHVGPRHRLFRTFSYIYIYITKPCQSVQTASSERAQSVSGNGSSCRALNMTWRP